MHHEGMDLRREHPSLALVAFVAAIEAIAQITKKPEKCDKCGMVLGSASRFRGAIEPALGEEEARLLGDAYGPRRSRTVHDARLHGSELQFGGWGSMSLFLPDDTFGFTAGTVVPAQKASRSLLLDALGVSLP